MEAEETKSNAFPDEIVTPAAGDLILGGLVFYALECVFVTPSKAPLVTFNSSGLGEVADVANSELEGEFRGDPLDHVGRCHYTLEEAAGGEGEIALTLKETRLGPIIGVFTGPAEGFGEAVLSGKGHLHVHPSSHSNHVRFIGDSSIKKIDFELESECITSGQPYHGTHWTWGSGGNQLIIDVKCGRARSELPWTYLWESANQEAKHLLTHAPDFPHRLNFAIRGVLTIDDQSFDVCMGQGHTDKPKHNPWYIASNDLIAKTGLIMARIGGYTISLGLDDVYTFDVRRA